MTDPRKDLPPVSAPNFTERLRETVSVYLGNRGDRMDRGLTLRDLVDANIIKLRAGFLAGSGGNPVAGPGSAAADAYQSDLTPPPAPDGLAATTSGASIQVTITPQTYRQGHGPAKVLVFGAKYLTGDPLPTYSGAAVLSEFTGDVHAFPVDSGSLYRIWAKSVSSDGVESSVAGGTNGVLPVAGLLDDVSIASLTAAKIKSGSITVGQFIQSANYVALTSGWRINGDGTAELANAIVRGGVYASYGLIGGNTIDASGLQSPGYVTGVSGWRLRSNGTAEFEAATIRGKLTTDQIQVGAASTLNYATSIYNGTGLTFNISAPRSESGDVAVASSSISSSGAQVKFSGFVHLSVDVALPTNVASIAVTVQPLIDGFGTFPPTGIYPQGVSAGGITNYPSTPKVSAFAGIHLVTPFFYTGAPVAGVHTYSVVVSLRTFDSTGALVSVAQNNLVNCFVTFTVFENKV